VVKAPAASVGGKAFLSVAVAELNRAFARRATAGGANALTP